jgi:hypothetical protein
VPKVPSRTARMMASVWRAATSAMRTSVLGLAVATQLVRAARPKRAVTK